MAADDNRVARRAIVGRREFLQGTTAALAATTLSPHVRAADAAPTASELVTGKDPRLVVHTKFPAVFETPSELLATEQITPTPLLFVRNVGQPGQAATLEPAKLEGWRIELAGLIDRTHTIEATELAKLPQVEHELVLQCSGNSRSLFAQSAKAKGTQWGRGGMGNVRFAGVPLATIVKHWNVKIDSQAKFLSAEGADPPPQGEQDFEHSLPLGETLKKSFLALRLNGQPLPAIHGGPVRLVTPGFYGTMNVKWLTRLRFDATESTHTSQIPNYRTPREPIAPGSKYDFTFDNSDSNWRMKIKSVVLAPAPGSTLSAGKVTVRGVAFNDGEARIDSVLVSPDGGRTWRQAQLDVPVSPYAWYRWQVELALDKGRHQIQARAVDALGRTQPLDGSVHWNPQGYTWNGVEKIDVTVS